MNEGKRRKLYDRTIDKAQEYNPEYNDPLNNPLRGTDDYSKALASISRQFDIRTQPRQLERQIENILPGFQSRNYQNVVGNTTVGVEYIASNNTDTNKHHSFKVDTIPKRALPNSGYYVCTIGLVKSDGAAIPDVDIQQLAPVQYFKNAIVKQLKITVDGSSTHFNNSSSILYEKGMLKDLSAKKSQFKLWSSDHTFLLTENSGGLTHNLQTRRTVVNADDDNVASNDRLDERLNGGLIRALCSAEGLLVRIPLGEIDDYFTSSSMTSNNTPLTVDVYLETNTNRLLESIKALPDPTGKPYRLKVLGTPRLTFSLCEATSEWEDSLADGFKTIASEMVVSEFKDAEQHIHHINRGLTKYEQVISQSGAQGDYLLVLMQLTANYLHDSMHDNRGHLTTNAIGKIKVSKLPVPNNSRQVQTIEYDLSSEQHRFELYKNYLTFVSGGSSAFPHDVRDVGDFKYIQSMTDFFRPGNSKFMIVLDLRTDRGILGEDNSTVLATDPTVELTFREALPAPTTIQIVSIYDASYNMVNTGTGTLYTYNPEAKKH